MEKLKDKLIYSSFGGISSAAGLISLSRCPGNACASCFGCAGMGIMLLAGVLIKKIKGGKGNNGMA